MNISSASIFSDDFHNWLKSLMREIISESLQEFRGQQENPYCSQIADTSVTKVYKRNEVATILKRTPTWVSTQIRNKKLQATFINGQYLISEKAIKKFIEKN